MTPQFPDPMAVTPLPADDGHEASFHRWSQRETDALTVAIAARRPLLVRGEPGTGKTQLARAAAVHLARRLLVETIHPRYEASDLVYRFDAVRRLADAQAGVPFDEPAYWQPGPLWQACDWASASRFGRCRQQTAPAGHVILIDEIDKADSDVPNSLLEVLGQRRLTVPALDQPLAAPDNPAPLILITTNEERELPAAFLRRCVVLNLEPDPDKSYAQWLTERGRTHYGVDQVPDEVLALAAEQLDADRRASIAAGLTPPGPAEYLDLIRAVFSLAPGQAGAQRRLLATLSAYTFVKNAAGDDGRAPRQQRQVEPSLRGAAAGSGAR